MFEHLLPPLIGKLRRLRTVKQRFKIKMDYNGPLVTDYKKIAIWPELAGTRCHDWIPCKGKDVYGQLQINGKKKQAHHVAWFLVFDEWPDNVFHKCDRRCCVNIEHLFIGTHQDNSNDKVAKGRQPIGDKHGRKLHPEAYLHLVGENCHQARLKNKQIAMIKVDHATGVFTYKQLAQKYRVSDSTIGYIVTGKTWKHIK